MKGFQRLHLNFLDLYVFFKKILGALLKCPSYRAIEPEIPSDP